jgi:hypothetical protein
MFLQRAVFASRLSKVLCISIASSVDTIVRGRRRKDVIAYSIHKAFLWLSPRPTEESERLEDYKKKT